MTKKKDDDVTRVCLYNHPPDGLDNSMIAHVNMETMLSIELSKAQAALRAARAAIKTAAKRTLQDRSVQAALAVIEDALP